MKTTFYILIFISFSVRLNGQTRAGYKEAIATMVSKDNYTHDHPFISNIGTRYDRSYTKYEFVVKKKFNEHYETEGAKCQNYEVKIVGETSADWEIGEKFIVMYDSTKYDNAPHFLVYYKPVFLVTENTITTKGKISKVFGLDRVNNGIGILFQYSISVINEKKDTAYTLVTKYQYLPPELDISKIKADSIKEYKVLFSPENPKRAIIYYSPSINSRGQTVMFDLDSIAITCRYKDFISAIEKDNIEENKNTRLQHLKTIQEKFKDTIKINSTEYDEFFGLELDWLIKKNKVTFFDNRTNKKVIHINKIKEGKRGHVLYTTYVDAETKNRLYSLVTRTWAF